MFDILCNIVTLATVGALNSRALNAVVDVGHTTNNDTVRVALQGAYGLTEVALSAALAPFGVKSFDKVPGSESSYTGSDGVTRTYSMDYATGVRVRGVKLMGGVS